MSGKNNEDPDRADSLSWSKLISIRSISGKSVTFKKRLDIHTLLSHQIPASAQLTPTLLFNSLPSLADTPYQAPAKYSV